MYLKVADLDGAALGGVAVDGAVDGDMVRLLIIQLLAVVWPLALGLFAELAAMLLLTAVGDATLGSRRRGPLGAEVRLSVAVWPSNVLTDMKLNHF